jgi:hypothetical protein
MRRRAGQAALLHLSPCRVGAAKRNPPGAEIIPQLRTFEIFGLMVQRFFTSLQQHLLHAMPLPLSLFLISGKDVPKLLTTGQLNILNLSSTFPRSLLKVSAGYLEISQPGYLKAPA